MPTSQANLIRTSSLRTSFLSRFDFLCFHTALAHSAPDVCNGTSAVGESRHRISRCVPLGATAMCRANTPRTPEDEVDSLESRGQVVIHGIPRRSGRPRTGPILQIGSGGARRRGPPASPWAPKSCMGDPCLGVAAHGVSGRPWCARRHEILAFGPKLSSPSPASTERTLNGCSTTLRRVSHCPRESMTRVGLVQALEHQHLIVEGA